MTTNLKNLGVFIALLLVTAACEAPDTGGEVPQTQQPSAVSADGPASIDHGGIEEVSDDPALIAQGQDVFRAKGCVACHQMGRDTAGPDLSGITDRRSAPWLARMIMSPQEMVAQDPAAKEVADRFPVGMTPSNLSTEEVDAIIAYLGTQ